MGALTKYRIFLCAGGMVACVFLLSRCVHHRSSAGAEEAASGRPGGQAAVAPRPVSSFDGRWFAGDAVCRDCHRALYDSFLLTAHWLTSRPAEEKYIKGHFPGEYAYDPHRRVIMEKREDGFYQTAYNDEKPGQSERFDIVVGSGRKGQTFLFWKDKELYQLPVSYFTSSESWANSPGYTTDTISFARHIEARCLECHTTFARQLSEYEFEPSQILYGVSCERCHGPAEKHVEYYQQHAGDHQQHPDGEKGLFIVNPAVLSRQQRLDACALCHSGVMRSDLPPFSFLAGDTLSHFFIPNSAHIDTVNLDVHANQYGLLTASRCFRNSQMDCSTCHDTHHRENDDLFAYGAKCMSCHKPAEAPKTGTAQTAHYCKFIPPTGFSMQAHCIDCHMPVRASRNLALLVAGQKTPSPEWVRSHRIAIYPDVTASVLGKKK